HSPSILPISHQTVLHPVLPHQRRHPPVRRPAEIFPEIPRNRRARINKFALLHSSLDRALLHSSLSSPAPPPPPPSSQPQEEGLIDCPRGRRRRRRRPRPGHAAAGSPSLPLSPDALPLPSQGLPMRANMELFGW
uniref:Uncharacterized protein n=1 Tax=Aegilops tauschii subsp. strangulata TaxID=200361 RepID=A0A453JEJ2_AEGTS